MNPEKSNRLIGEKSPYLLQHAFNPVDWYPWSQEAFVRARQENKPVFLSIGYSTCHWCHVMAHESFENPAIAAILNEHFIAIKIDREERPDIDGIYMSAVMAMVGSGGWPLSIFLTPDQKPFYGGTYFPPEPRWGAPGFKQLLLSVYNTWISQRERILESSNSITAALKERAQRVGELHPLNPDVGAVAYRQLAENFDSVYGGFGSAPKFPMGHNLSFLLRYWKKTKEDKALTIVAKTLDEMAKGGMYDHLGGGFHRYSTDAQWQVPHFEKMLYDQAILSRAYLEGFQATGKSEYGQVAREIFDYVLRDMRDAKGGFYSAEDADSLEPEAEESTAQTFSHDKKEGAFYVWRYEEITEHLDEKEASIVSYYWGLEKDGNARFDPHGEFVRKNIIGIAHRLEETGQHFQVDAARVEDIVRRVKVALLNARQKRPRPHLDDKILTDWNGLMISSLALGAVILQDEQYLKAARQAADFILAELYDEKAAVLYHRYREGERAVAGLLDDYAFFVHGLLDLYQVCFEVKYLQAAVKLAEQMNDLFWDTSAGGFYLTSRNAQELIWRPKEIYDGAVPSGNSFAALDCVRLYQLTLNDLWRQKAENIFQAFGSEVENSPGAYAQLLSAFDFWLGPSQEIVVAGQTDSPVVKDILKDLYRHFVPSKVVIVRPPAGEALQRLLPLVPFIKDQTLQGDCPTVYICSKHACQRPLTELKDIFAAFSVL